MKTRPRGSAASSLSTRAARSATTLTTTSTGTSRSGTRSSTRNSCDLGSKVREGPAEEAGPFQFSFPGPQASFEPARVNPRRLEDSPAGLGPLNFHFAISASLPTRYTANRTIFCLSTIERCPPMRMLRSFLLLAVLAVLCASRAQADDKSRRQAAEELLKATNVEKVMQSTMDQMLDVQIKQQPELAPYRGVLK